MTTDTLKPSVRRSGVIERASDSPIADDHGLMASPDAISELLRLLCVRYRWDLAEYWQVDAEAEVLRRTQFHWPGPAPEPSLIRITAGVAIVRGVGIVGRVWATGSGEWIEDISTRTGFVRVKEAAEGGFHSAAILPVFNQDDIVGGVALFSCERRNRDDAALESMLGLAARVAEAANLAPQISGDHYFRALTDQIADIVAVISADGIIVFESASVRAVLGYRREDRIGRNVFDFIHPEDLPVAAGAMRAGLKTPGSVQRLRVRARHADGSWRWLDSVGTIQQDPSGGVVAIVNSRDITEAKAAQDALSEAHARLQVLNSVAKAALVGRSTRDILARAVNQLAKHFANMRVAYSTVDEQGQLTVVHSVEPEGMPPLAGLTADLNIAPDYLAALRLRETLAVTDVASDARLKCLSDAMEAGGTRAVLDVPVNYSQRLVGLLCFDSPDVREWRDHEITTLREVAQYLAVALREAHSRELRRAVEQRLHSVTEQLRGVLDAMPAPRPAPDARHSDQPERPPSAHAGRRKGSGSGTVRRLSPQELEVLSLLARGRTNRQIADELYLSPHTVKEYVNNLSSKLGARNRTEAAHLASKRGLI